MNFNYQKICLDLLENLPERQKEVILQRFGLSAQNPYPILVEGKVKRKTLESIGKSYGICRERVRQIEADGFLRIKPKLNQHQKLFQYFISFLRNSGGLKKEDILLSQLGGKKFQNQIYFLLEVAEPFERFAENKDFYSFWTINPDSLNLAQKAIDDIFNKLRKIKTPLSLKDYNPPSPAKISEGNLGGQATLTSSPTVRLTPAVLFSYLEISKKIQRNSEGLFGLENWPEINPRGVKDKAYLVFKKEKRPLHFNQVAEEIGDSALPQTVHNELIKDSRFVLVGRGMYALKEWGYEEGVVKDIILKVLKEAGEPLSKEEILKKVLKQRLVKENTILLNLSNKRYFLRDIQGKYQINPVREA